MDERGLRRRCIRLIRDLGVDAPIDPALLCARLAAKRGRPIALEARQIPGATGIGFGSLLPMPTKDVILYPSDVSPPWQAHIVFHEVLHLVLGHVERGYSAAEPMACGAEAEQTDELINSSTVSYYFRSQEWEAETGAAILSELSAATIASVRADHDGLTVAERAYARAIGGSFTP